MFEAQVKLTEPETVAFVTMHGAYSQIPRGYGQLYGWVQAHHLEPEGMPHAVYLTDPQEVPEEQAVWELWAPVRPSTPEVPVDESGIGVKRMAEHLVASATHVGSYESLGTTYDTLMRWIEDHSYRVSGPPEEIYFSDPEEVAPSDFVTEIRLPVTEQ